MKIFLYSACQWFSIGIPQYCVKIESLFNYGKRLSLIDEQLNYFTGITQVSENCYLGFVTTKKLKTTASYLWKLLICKLCIIVTCIFIRICAACDRRPILGLKCNRLVNIVNRIKNHLICIF